MGPLDATTIEVEAALLEVLREQDLSRFQEKLTFDKQLTRLDHFQHVTDDELMAYGLSAPSVRRLRAAIAERNSRQTKRKKESASLVVLSRSTRVDSDITASFLDISTGDTSSTSSAARTLPCLIGKEEIKQLETLGEGTFAVVKRAIWRRPGAPQSATTECAVKILHELSEAMQKDLFDEIGNMQKLRHPNLVVLYGVVLGGEATVSAAGVPRQLPTLMVIEYCSDGALLDRLRSTTKPRLLVTRLLNYAQQICNGMSYLESRRCVHRDLAARNVLLTDNEEVVKICDFGLTRFLQENQRLYVMSETKKVAFSWCPPESLRYRQFSHKSDVWAFGVTLWELFTFGEEPWIGYRAADVLRALESGECLRRAEYASPEIANLITMCWRWEPEERPKFSQLRKLLQDVKFMTAVCNSSVRNSPTLGGRTQIGEDKVLRLKPDEQVVVIGERTEHLWFGQSVQTREFGVFHRPQVRVQSHRVAPVEQQIVQHSSKKKSMGSNAVIADKLATLNTGYKTPCVNSGLVNGDGGAAGRKEISRPVPGSLIHTGHGDTEEYRSWGRVDRIDDVYLKNPVLAMPGTEMDQGGGGGVSFINSLRELHGQGQEHAPTWANAQEGSVYGRTSAATKNENALAGLPFEKIMSTPVSDPHRRRASAEELTKIFEKSSIAALVPPPSNTQPRRPVSQLLETSSSSRHSATTMGTMAAAGGAGERKGTFPQLAPSATNKNFSMTPSLEEMKKHNKAFSWIEEEFKANKAKYDGSISVPRPKPRCAFPPALSAVCSVPPTACGASSSTASSSSGNRITPPPPVPTPNSAAAATIRSEIASPYGVSKSASQSSLPLDPKPSGDDSVERVSEDPFVVKSEVKSLAHSARYKEVLQQKLALEKKEQSNTSLPNQERQSAVGDPPPTFLPPPSQLLLSGMGLDSHSTPNLMAAQHSAIQFGPTQNHLQPIFSLTSHTSHLGFETDNGIPVMEPIPAAPITIKKEQIPAAKEKGSVMVELKDLDLDAMIARMRRDAEFASDEQCIKALRKHAYDVENAIRELKVEKLIEMGLSADRQLASSALDYCQWNINATITSLLGSSSS